ncbi:MAG: intradiol ring-cleavage dioxygenase [Pseudomonadota bacterium]
MERRRFLKLTGASGLVLLSTHSDAQECLEATQPQTSGPFYPLEEPLDSDADLAWVQGQDRIASGIVTNLTGRVLDATGNVIPSARVEIWQTDAFGFYHHPRDRGGRAEAQFQGFGKATVDGTGRYRFRTVRPVAYPGRTPHIHARVYAKGIEPMTTQIYLSGEPRNGTDYLYNSIPVEKRADQTIRFPESETDITPAEFDFILGHTHECT